IDQIENHSNTTIEHKEFELILLDSDQSEMCTVCPCGWTYKKIFIQHSLKQ
ncbi:2509_t:CDS:1, partial [Entrophospora sp. SA101]